MINSHVSQAEVQAKVQQLIAESDTATVHAWLDTPEREAAGLDYAAGRFGPALAEAPMQPLRPPVEVYRAETAIEVFGVLWKDGAVVVQLAPQRLMPGDGYNIAISAAVVTY